MSTHWAKKYFNASGFTNSTNNYCSKWGDYNLYCEINLLHPFREGNGRTQRLFFEEVMFSVGYDVTWPPLSQEQWIEANVAGVFLNLNPLEHIFEQALRKI